MTALAYVPAPQTCDCGLDATHIVCGFPLCSHCLLDDEFKMLDAIFFWQRAEPEMPRELYDLQESIRAACCRWPDEAAWLDKAAADIKRFIRQNLRCDDPIPPLERLRDDLWELAP